MCRSPSTCAAASPNFVICARTQCEYVPCSRSGARNALMGIRPARWPGSARYLILPHWRPLPAAWRTLTATPRSWPRSATGSSRAAWASWACLSALSQPALPVEQIARKGEQLSLPLVCCCRFSQLLNIICNYFDIVRFTEPLEDDAVCEGDRRWSVIDEPGA